VPSSAHCRSSRISTRPRSAAARTRNLVIPSSSACRSAAGGSEHASGVSGRRRRSSGNTLASRGASSPAASTSSESLIDAANVSTTCTNGSNDRLSWASGQRPKAVRASWAAARSAISAASRVLPIPASPARTIKPPRPERAAFSSGQRCASSTSRPTSSVEDVPNGGPGSREAAGATLGPTSQDGELPGSGW